MAGPPALGFADFDLAKRWGKMMRMAVPIKIMGTASLVAPSRITWDVWVSLLRRLGYLVGLTFVAEGDSVSIRKEDRESMLLVGVRRSGSLHLHTPSDVAVESAAAWLLAAHCLHSNTHFTAGGLIASVTFHSVDHLTLWVDGHLLAREVLGDCAFLPNYVCR